MKYKMDFMCVFLMVTVVSATAGFSIEASANGGEFMGDLSSADHGTSFFGFVKDTNGKALPATQVILNCKVGCVETHVSADVLGHYFFSGFQKDIDAKTVDVSCRKMGYSLVSKVNRPPVGTITNTTPIEIDCVMREETK